MAVEGLEVGNTKAKSLCDDSMQTNGYVNESENLDVDILADLDSYMQDIDDRLTILRMVSDSLTRGLVNAVTQEAAEKIAQKELELVELKEMLNVQRQSVDGKDNFKSQRVHSSFSEAVMKHDRMKGTLGSLRSASKEQFVRLREDIDCVKACSSVKIRSPDSKMLGLGGILHDEDSSEPLGDVDNTVDGFEATIESVFKGVEEIVQLSEASMHEWKREQEFQGEIEELVMGNCIRCLEQEFEGKLWDRICGDKAINWSERMKEISSLREELNSISKSLCVPEAGHLISHGSLDSVVWTNGSSSHFHRNSLGSHAENGKHEQSQIDKLEHSDPNYLGHLTRDELVLHYNNEITRMKRNHESKVQDMTEEYFSLKREYLKEKGSSLLLKKDKEIMTLRRRIPEVISKLDDILVETEKIPALFNNAEGLSSLKDRLEALLAENRQLRDFISDKKKEVKCLATQVSDASDKMSHHSLSETKLLNMVRNLKSSIEDLRIEALIYSDISTCLLREMTGQIQCSLENSHAEYNEMQQRYESVIKASHDTQLASKCGVGDSDMLSILTQDLLEVIYREAWQEAKNEHNVLTNKYLGETEARVSLQKEALENKRVLETELAEKERLKQEIHGLAEEKQRLAQDSAAVIQSEKERVRLASEEIENLKIQQRKLLSKTTRQSEDMKCELAAAMEEVELYKLNLGKMNEKLEQAVQELKEVDEERRKHLAVSLEKEKALALRDASEREVRKQMESMIVLVQGVSRATTDFENRVTNSISKNCLRYFLHQFLFNRNFFILDFFLNLFI